jgi:hypothetical protein
VGFDNNFFLLFRPGFERRPDSIVVFLQKERSYMLLQYIAVQNLGDCTNTTSLQTHYKKAEPLFTRKRLKLESFRKKTDVGVD